MFLTSHQGLDCRLRALRAATAKEGWNKNEKDFLAVAYASIALAKAYMEQDRESLLRHLYSAKLQLKSVLKKSEVPSDCLLSIVNTNSFIRLLRNAFHIDALNESSIVNTPGVVPRQRGIQASAVHACKSRGKRKAP